MPTTKGSYLALLLSLTVLACAEPAAPSSVGKAEQKTTDTPKVTVDRDPSKAAQPEPTPAEPALEISGDILSFGAAKIWRSGHEDRAFELYADGSVTLAGNPYAKLQADGRMLSPVGEELMLVEPNGAVTTSNGSTGMTITADGGALNLPSLKVKLRFADSGAIETDASGPSAGLIGAGAPQLQSSGCTGEVQRACTLITLSYLSALGNPDSVRQEDAPAP